MLECYCDYDAPQLYRARRVTARKAHRCTECGRSIRPGECYEYVFGKWDGDVGAMKTCSHCVNIRTFVKNSVPCFCWSHGNMLDDAAGAIEHAYYRGRDEVRGLFVGYARLVIRGRHARQAG